MNLKADNDEVSIALSKFRLIFMLLGSLFFIAFAIWLMNNKLGINHFIYGNSVFLMVLALIAIVFFVIAFFAVLFKLKDKKPGIIINRNGITDQSSAISVGLICWHDIIEIKSLIFRRQKFIGIFVREPGKYLKRIKNPVLRFFVKVNYKIYGTPIHISANTLQISFDKLFYILNSKMKEYTSEI